MRKWAYLREPRECNKEDLVYKIMVYETKKEGTFVFLYTKRDAIMCSYDEWYANIEDALEDWQDEIGENEWHVIEDPLPYCQHDCIEPIRVKGRNLKAPEWGHYEMLKDGEWVAYTMNPTN